MKQVQTKHNKNKKINITKTKTNLPLTTKTTSPKYKSSHIYLLPLFVMHCQIQSSRIRGWGWRKRSSILSKINSQSNNICDKIIQKLSLSRHECLHHDMLWRLHLKDSLKHGVERCRGCRRANCSNIYISIILLIIIRNSNSGINRHILSSRLYSRSLCCTTTWFNSLLLCTTLFEKCSSYGYCEMNLL